MNEMIEYDVFKDAELIFTGKENEAEKVFNRLNVFYKYNNNKISMVKHDGNNGNKPKPAYNKFVKFKNSYHNFLCFEDLNSSYDSDDKYIVENERELKSILDTSPDNIEIDFLDLKHIYNLTLFSVKPSIKIRFNTNHIKDFNGFFSYYRYINGHDFYKREPYQYDLDWVYIKKGAIISEMFKYTKFNKKLPKMETKISFNQFVKRTGLIVTPDLLKNNDMPIEEWCKNKHNQKLMKTNEQYKPMLEFWINSDFITVEERINAMQVSGIEIFVI